MDAKKSKAHGNGASLSEAQKAIAEFFEGMPLYSPVVIELSEAATVDAITPRAFSRWCSGCHSSTTWTRNSDMRYQSIEFKCVQCQEEQVAFRLRIEPDPYPAQPATISIGSVGGSPRPLRRSRTWTIRKWGQWPAWSITPAPEIRDALTTDDLDLYRKALICASQGYGIGALSYFRRVVENTINSMLDLVEEAADAECDREALANVQRARESKQTEEKLALITGHVPHALRPGRANPLAVLHDRYSKGLHALQDDECVRIAIDLRKAFDFVFRSLKQRAREAREYAREMTALAGQTRKPGEK